MENRIYKLTETQNIVLIQKKVSRHEGLSQLPVVFSVDKELDFQLLHDAINMEIERNDSLRIKFLKINGQQMQTFIEPYKIDKIKTVDFSGKTKQQQDGYLRKITSQKLNLERAETFKVVFLKTFEGKYGFYFSVSHAVCDEWGTFRTVADILDIYRHLAYGEDMPAPLGSFEKIVAKEELIPQEKFDKDRDFFLNYYDKLGKPERFSEIIDKRLPYKKHEGKLAGNMLFNFIKSVFCDSSLCIEKRVPADTFEKWKNFCHNERISMNTLVYFGFSSYLSKINNSNDIFYAGICNCRFSNQSKITAGATVKAFYYRFIPNDSDNIKEVMLNISNTLFRFYRHLSIPITQLNLEQKYNVYMHNHYGSPLFGYVNSVYNAPKDWNFNFELVCQGYSPVPEYLYVMPDSFSGELLFHFEYLKTHSNQIQIESQFVGICDAINAAVDNPYLTFKQIKDSIK